MDLRHFTSIFILCISLILASGEKPEDETSNTHQNSQEKSPSSEESLQAAAINKRWFGFGFGFGNDASNKFRKAVDEQQKLDLELAMETTRLDELNKLRESENIDDTTPFAKLNSWQVTLLNDIKKSKNRNEELTVKAAVSNALVEKLTASNDSNIKSERQIKDRTNKLIRAVGDKSKADMELAIATKKLEELQKQKEAEKIDISIAPIKLTKWQQNLLSNIVKAKENKGYLTVPAAVMATKVNQLKHHLTELGGTPDSVIDATNKKMQKQIREKVYKAEKNLAKINMDLQLATTKLEQLEKQREEETVYDTNSKNKLNRIFKSLLDDIEKTKEKKYDLTLRAALEKQTIDQLKLHLNSNEKTSTDPTGRGKNSKNRSGPGGRRSGSIPD